MENEKKAPSKKEIPLKGLTREIIIDLLEIYNKNKVPESHSKCNAGAGTRVDAASLKKIVSSFGLGFTNEEVNRAIISFSRGDALTFSDFINFYLWYIPIYRQIINKTQKAINNIPREEYIQEFKNLIRKSKGIDPNIIGFLLSDLEQFYAEKDKEKKKELIDFPKAVIKQFNCLPQNVNFSRKENIHPYLKFDITLWNIFGLIPYEYIGIENDIPSLDAFVEVELCNQTFKSSVFPARYSPSISQTFSFEFNSPLEMSFLDASWWIQNAKLKISVYGVHYLDKSVAYHLLGTANQPLIPLLIDQHGRTTCAINLQALAPSYPIPILVSITNKCKENDENDKKGQMKEKSEFKTRTVNPLIYHTAPIEQLIFERFLRQIRSDITGKNGILDRTNSQQVFSNYCNFFKEISVRFPAREYQLLGFDEMNVAHFINTFLYKNGIKIRTNKYKEVYKITDKIKAKIQGKYKIKDKINEEYRNKIKNLIYIVSLTGYTVFDRPEPEVMQIRSLITTKTCKLDPNIMERAILLCNLLTAFGIESYVCVGDHQFQRYVWVMTRRNDLIEYETLPDFMMFDCGNKAYTVSSFINHEYEFPTTSAIDRIDGQQQIIFSHGINPLFLGINSVSSRTEEDHYFKNKKDDTRNSTSEMCHWSVTGIWPDRVPCGLKVATVFNSKQIYCNIQNCDDIEVVKWDLNNTANWAPFYEQSYDIEKRVYPERFVQRMLKKPEFIFTDEEKMKMKKLLFIKKFNMFKKNALKNSFDKFTRDALEFHIDCENMYAFKIAYQKQDQEFLEKYYKSHLQSLLETQLLLNLTPIQRQILNSLLICKEIDKENNKEIDIKQKRFKILLKSQNKEERAKINSIIKKINLSMLKLNSNGHVKFIESESITRFLYTYENVNSIFEKLNYEEKEKKKEEENEEEEEEKEEEEKEEDNKMFSQIDFFERLNSGKKEHNKMISQIDFFEKLNSGKKDNNKMISQIDFFEKLRDKNLLSQEDIKVCNKYILNFQLDYLHLINSFDEYNNSNYQPIVDTFNKSLSETFESMCQLIINLINNMNEDEFSIVKKKMEKVDPTFSKYFENNNKKDGIEKYISSKENASEYLKLDILLQTCESLSRQDQIFDKKENEEDIENENNISKKEIAYSNIINKVQDIYIYQKKQIELTIDDPKKIYESTLYIPESVVKKELLKIIREEKESIYQYYSSQKFFLHSFPSWNSEDGDYQLDETEKNYMKQKILNEKLEILSLVEMVLEIFYKAIYNENMAFILPQQTKSNKKEFDDNTTKFIDDLFNQEAYDSNCFNRPFYQKIYIKNNKIESDTGKSKDEIEFNFENNEGKEIKIEIKNSIKFIIDDYRLIFGKKNQKLYESYKKYIDSLLPKNEAKIYNEHIKYKISLYIKKALIAIKKVPKYGLPNPDDWFVRCDKKNIYSIAKEYIKKIKESDMNTGEKDVFEIIDDELKNLNRYECFNDTNCRIQFLGQMLIEIGKILQISQRENANKENNDDFQIYIDSMFKSLVSDNELIEFRMFRQNIAVFKAVQNVLNDIQKCFERNYSLIDLYESLGQSIPDIDASIEEFNEELLNKLTEKNEKFIDKRRLKEKEKLIKKRIESFRLTGELIKRCAIVNKKSSSYLIPKEIIVKPPNLIDFYPNSMSNFFMECRLIIEHIRNKPFFFLFYNNNSIQSNQQRPQQLTEQQIEQQQIEEKQEQEQHKNSTINLMLNLRNQMVIQKENRIKRYEQQVNYHHEDVKQYIKNLQAQYSLYDNKIKNDTKKEKYEEIKIEIEYDEYYSKINQYLDNSQLYETEKNELMQLKNNFDSMLSYLSVVKRKNASKEILAIPKKRESQLIARLPNRASSQTNIQKNEFKNKKQTKTDIKTISNDIKIHNFKYLMNDKKKRKLLKKRWESRLKVKDIIKSIHLDDETVVPYIPFESKKERYIDYINYVKAEPDIKFDENQKKELNNILHLDVAMSTSSSLLIFHKKWSEDKLIKKIQKILISFEKEIIKNGRYDINKLHQTVSKSIRSHRYMLRVSKHKIDDPLYLADQLSLSGALTSSCGAEKCIIVAQPFRYVLEARSTWIVLLFIYKVPDNLTFSEKEKEPTK